MSAARWQRPHSRTSATYGPLHHDIAACSSAVAAVLADVRTARKALHAAELVLLSLHPDEDVDVLVPRLSSYSHDTSARPPLAFEMVTNVAPSSCPLRSSGGYAWRHSHSRSLSGEWNPPISPSSPALFPAPLLPFDDDDLEPDPDVELSARYCAKASLRDLLHGHDTDDDILLPCIDARASTASSASTATSCSSGSATSTSGRSCHSHPSQPSQHSPGRAHRSSQLEQIVEEDVGEIAGGRITAPLLQPEAEQPPPQQLQERGEPVPWNSKSDPSKRTKLPAQKGRLAINLHAYPNDQLLSPGSCERLPQTPHNCKVDTAFLQASMMVTPDSTIALSEMIGMQLARDIAESRQTEPPRSSFDQQQQPHQQHEHHVAHDFLDSLDSWPSAGATSTSESAGHQEATRQDDERVQSGDRDPPSLAQVDVEDALAQPLSDASQAFSLPDEKETEGHPDGETSESAPASGRRSEAGGPTGQRTLLDSNHGLSPSSETLNDEREATAAQTLRLELNAAAILRPGRQSSMDDRELGQSRQEQPGAFTEAHRSTAEADASTVSRASSGLHHGAVSASTDTGSEPGQEDADASDAPPRTSSSGSLSSFGNWHDWSSDSKTFLNPRQAPRPPVAQVTFQEPEQLGGLRRSNTARDPPRYHHHRAKSDLTFSSHSHHPSRGSSKVMSSNPNPNPNPDQRGLLGLVNAKLRIGRASGPSGKGGDTKHRRTRTFDSSMLTSTGTTAAAYEHGLAQSKATQQQRQPQRLAPMHPPPPSSRLAEMLPRDGIVGSSAGAVPHGTVSACPSGASQHEARMSKNQSLSNKLFTWKSKSKAREPAESGGELASGSLAERLPGRPTLATSPVPAPPPGATRARGSTPGVATKPAAATPASDAAAAALKGPEVDPVQVISGKSSLAAAAQPFPMTQGNRPRCSTVTGIGPEQDRSRAEAARAVAGAAARPRPAMSLDEMRPASTSHVCLLPEIVEQPRRSQSFRSSDTGGRTTGHPSPRPRAGFETKRRVPGERFRTSKGREDEVRSRGGRGAGSRLSIPEGSPDAPRSVSSRASSAMGPSVVKGGVVLTAAKAG